MARSRGEGGRLGLSCDFAEFDAEHRDGALQAQVAFQYDQSVATTPSPCRT